MIAFCVSVHQVYHNVTFLPATASIIVQALDSPHDSVWVIRVWMRMHQFLPNSNLPHLLTVSMNSSTFFHKNLIFNHSVVPCPVQLLLPDLHTNFSRGRSGGLVFPSLSEFSTVYCDPHSQRLWHSQSSINRCFSGTLLLFQWSIRCWQFDLWFLCLF